MTVTRTPDEVREQRACALAKANSVRVAKATAKKQLRSVRKLTDVRVALARMVADPPECLCSTPVAEALGWGWYVGANRARYLVTRAKVNGAKPLGDLHETERKRLAFVIQTVSWQ